MLETPVAAAESEMAIAGDSHSQTGTCTAGSLVTRYPRIKQGTKVAIGGLHAREGRQIHRLDTR